MVGIYRIIIIIIPPTLLTESPTEAVRTGALKRVSLCDQRADPSILTRVDLTGICDSAWCVDENWNKKKTSTRGKQWEDKPTRKVKNITETISECTCVFRWLTIRPSFVWCTEAKPSVPVKIMSEWAPTTNRRNKCHQLRIFTVRLYQFFCFMLYCGFSPFNMSAGIRRYWEYHL